MRKTIQTATCSVTYTKDKVLITRYAGSKVVGIIEIPNKDFDKMADVFVGFQLTLAAEGK